MRPGHFSDPERAELKTYLARVKVAYIQEYLPHERDLRVVLINYQPVLTYWRVRPRDDFRTNLARGGRIDFDHIPSEAIELAVATARQCRFDDVGLDLIPTAGGWRIIEANMKYGRKGLKLQGLDLGKIMREKLLSGELLEAHAQLH